MKSYDPANDPAALRRMLKFIEFVDFNREREAWFIATIKKSIETLETLRWLEFDSLRFRYARVPDGVYQIEPSFERRKRVRTFIGYVVQFLPMQSNDPEVADNPFFVEEEDIRTIATGVQSEVEAKATAQADFSSRCRQAIEDDPLFARLM